MSQEFLMDITQFKKKITELFGRNKVTSIKIISLKEDYISNCRIEITFSDGLTQNYTTIARFDGTLGILALNTSRSAQKTNSAGTPPEPPLA